MPHDDSTGAPPGAGQFRILFGGPNHGDTPFSSATLAHAFYPPPNGTTAAGDVHFNDDYTWSLNGASGGASPIDLGTVMLHEAGHSLGLGHEPTIDAVMNPVYQGPRGLSPDDIAGIRALYCPTQAGAATPIDLIFLFDMTGSFADDLPNVQAQIGPLLTSIKSTFTDVRFGVASFRDFPFSPWGDPGDYVYRVEQTMTTDSAVIQSAIMGLSADGGADFPEAQYQAIHQVLTGGGLDLNGNGSYGDPGDVAPSALGLGANRLPVIFLLTDADFHDPEAEPGYPCAGCSTAGRSVVLADIASHHAKIFVLIATTPPDVSGQQSGTSLHWKARPLDSAAQELAQASGGGVLPVGTSSERLSMAAATALRQVQNAPLAVAVVPTLSREGLLALGLAIVAVGWISLRRRIRRAPEQ